VALAEGDRGAFLGVAWTSGTRRGKPGPRRWQLSIDVSRGGGGGAQLGGPDDGEGDAMAALTGETRWCVRLAQSGQLRL
jgi:hypothetical protein